MVPGDGDSAAERVADVFEAAHVIALPAVERDGNLRESAEGAVHIDAEGGVAFVGESVGGGGGFGAGHGGDS